MKHPSNPGVGHLRIIGIAEGISLLLLLFIAMPLKYFAGKPEAVKVVGWLHGVLFVAFVMVLFFTWLQRKWPFKMLVFGFIAAFVPFGTFVFDARLKKEQTISG